MINFDRTLYDKGKEGSVLEAITLPLYMAVVTFVTAGIVIGYEINNASKYIKKLYHSLKKEN